MRVRDQAPQAPLTVSEWRHCGLQPGPNQAGLGEGPPNSSFRWDGSPPPTAPEDESENLLPAHGPRPIIIQSLVRKTEAGQAGEPGAEAGSAGWGPLLTPGCAMLPAAENMKGPSHPQQGPP